MGVTRYTEHRVLEVGPLLVADSTMESGARLVWVGAGGMEGRWVTHGEFRGIVAELVKFADALPPSGVPAAPATGREQVLQILHCADAYGDARIMASKGRVDRSEVDAAREELRALVERALGVSAAQDQTFQPSATDGGA